MQPMKNYKKTVGLQYNIVLLSGPNLLITISISYEVMTWAQKILQN